MSLGEVVKMATWPISNLVGMVTSPVPDKPPMEGSEQRYAGKPVANTILDHVVVQSACLWKLAIAAAVYRYTDAPSASEWAVQWMIPIIVRDVCIAFVAAGCWDFLLYSSYSPVYTRMSQYKFNPTYPKPKQIAHDMFWVLVSTLISSVFEILLLHAYSTGQLSYANPAVWWSDVSTIFWILSMPYWRLAHFYVVHRMMHPWKTTAIPDVGRFLYNHVHSLHHRSKNPTAFSGTSMHPIESMIYYTASLIPVCFGAHPLIFLYTKFDLTLAALIGHDGFGFPGSGSQTHWLHHHLFECNYGENYAPFDWLFGTFASSEADFQQKFGAGKSHAAPQVAADEAAAPPSRSSTNHKSKKH